MTKTSDLKYMNGLGNLCATEALPGVLPVGQNAPQKVAKGLYAEQLTGSAFTAPRAENFKAWTYRIAPTVVQGRFEKVTNYQTKSGPFEESPWDPNPMRWQPMGYPKAPTEFWDSWVTVCGSGSPYEQHGLAMHLYAANTEKTDRYFYSSDSEIVLLPVEGALLLKTEMGVLEIPPGYIGVLPRGIKAQMRLPEQKSRGYVCENYGRNFRLPELGPIGANGLANPQDFEIPVASFEDKSGNFEMLTKFQGTLWRAELKHSPLDVVAWRGNYAPYRYDLFKYNTIGSISYDHPDPSIFTVLTSPSDQAGCANIDFVIFPPRWLVMENSFKPPYYHRNTMSEFMGLIKGVYDAKEKGFVPGGFSLHNQMTGHGPETEVFIKASESEQKPLKLDNTMAFMFESRWPFRLTKWAAETELLEKDYRNCWQTLPRMFKG